MSLEIIILALFIGILLGLIGGGGSILTVPVLVYVAGIAPVMATAYSLFIVGSTSLVGAINYFRKKLVHIPTALVFAIPSFISVYAVRRYVITAIPETLFSIGNFTVTKSIFIMVLFATIMVLAAISMICAKNQDLESGDISKISFNYPLIFGEGLLVGALTGFVGAGGGFLIIPALVMFAKLPMRLAIGTSLLIIAIKSLIGFMGDVHNLVVIDWTLLGSFTAIASGGIFIGSSIGKKVEANSLKKIFGWFVLVMAVYILYKELTK